jgi:hypothetical protein
LFETFQPQFQEDIFEVCKKSGCFKKCCQKIGAQINKIDDNVPQQYHDQAVELLQQDFNQWRETSIKLLISIFGYSSVLPTIDVTKQSELNTCWEKYFPKFKIIYESLEPDVNFEQTQPLLNMFYSLGNRELGLQEELITEPGEEPEDEPKE